MSKTTELTLLIVLYLLIIFQCNVYKFLTQLLDFLDNFFYKDTANILQDLSYCKKKLPT